MAAAQQAVSFNEIIQTSRQKKKNEELANKILGKNRRASAPGSGVGKPQNATPGSLASRVGVTKRSSSANLGSKNSRGSAAGPNTAPPPSKPARRRRPGEARLMSALNPANGQATVRNTTGGISIKGTGSESFVVVGKNFAPGTTAADIQSAIEPVSGKVVSCWVTSHQPTVTAEITFKEKSSAEKAVANFHNQRADGRLLSIQLKSSTNRDVLDRPSTSFNQQREQTDRERRSQRTADPAVQDGSFGFDEQSNQSYNSRNSGRGRNQRGSRGRRIFGAGDRKSNQASQETGLYSDEMMVDAPPTHPRGRGNRRQ
ncbi:hypothetical protein BJX68DRAFT_197837 [Aspergillus pseudodeflectus]|uniref:RRM domain-containing protein n=1 Tax=Aspergillus pseudodeflectus TaxID=176178 RepID=A0ABR4JHN5_9EURO